jgi:acetyltransferase-like isoleucine patch superfamily enzyme
MARAVKDVTDGGRLEIAPDAVLGDGCRFHVRGATVRIGAGARLGDRCVVLAHAGIEVGAGAVLGDDVVLVDFTHRHDDAESPVRRQGLEARPIVVGAGAVVGHRVVIEAGAIVSAGGRVPAQTVVGSTLRS